MKGLRGGMIAQFGKLQCAGVERYKTDADDAGICHVCSLNCGFSHWSNTIHQYLLLSLLVKWYPAIINHSISWSGTQRSLTIQSHNQSFRTHSRQKGSFQCRTVSKYHSGVTHTHILSVNRVTTLPVSYYPTQHLISLCKLIAVRLQHFQLRGPMLPEHPSSHCKRENDVL